MPRDDPPAPTSSRSLASRLRVYLVADFTRRDPARVLEVVDEVLAAGVTAVQYRDKSDADGLERRRRAVAVVERARRAGALAIVNDDAALAEVVGSDGVHLGPLDVRPSAVRRRYGDQLLIGGSAGTPERAAAVEADGADYLGVGAIFDAHATKPDASAPRGPDALTAVVGRVAIPVVAIGGVAVGNAASAVAAGAEGVAVVRALLDAERPGDAARDLVEAVREGLTRRGGLWDPSGRGGSQ